MDAEHAAANRRNWDERAAIHAVSETYGLYRFTDDPTVLSTIVQFDREGLGDLTGQRAVHLQCHIGTDTISLARLGASVTGLDQSPVSLEVARKLFADTATPGTFVESGVYEALDVLPAGSFDLVYTGVGALNWLPDIRRWAEVVAGLLKPGGRLFIREGHPVLWALDYERDDNELVFAYPYFEVAPPMVFDEEGTYTDGDATITNTRTYEWNHGLGQIVTAVLEAGMRLEGLTEHRELEWKPLEHMVETAEGRYRLPAPQDDMVPLMYTMMARRIS